MGLQHTLPPEVRLIYLKNILLFKIRDSIKCLRGHPELSMFSAYETLSHRGQGVSCERRGQGVEKYERRFLK